MVPGLMAEEHAAVENLPYKWKALITVALGTMLATLDASIINIAYPHLTRVFNVDLTTVIWVTLVYIIVSSGSMLAFGKLSDAIGRKKIYATGLVIFTVGMALCSMARNVPEIIVFRIIQAIGAAMSVGCSTAIVTEAFPYGEMGRGLGMLGMAVSVGFIIGPVAGGFLLDWLGWRAIFYMRIPFGILAFVLAFLLLKRDEARQKKLKLDIPGTITSFASVLCLLLGMGQVKTHGLASGINIALICAAALFFGLFLVWEGRAAEPIVDLGLFRKRAFSCAMTAFFVFFLTVPLYAVIMPFFLMDAIKLAASKAGLVLAAIPVATLIASPLSGFVSDRLGSRWPSVAGAGMITVSFLLMFRFGLHTGLSEIIAVLALLGFGVGVFQPPNNSSVMGTVEPARLGSVSALMATTRQVSISIGMAMTGSVFSVRQGIYNDILRSKELDAAELLRHSTVPALRDVVFIVFCLSAAVIILSMATKKEQKGSL